jgi:hypothetical protein
MVPEEFSSGGPPVCAVAEHTPRTMRTQIRSSCPNENRNGSSRGPVRILRSDPFEADGTPV